MPPTPLIGGLCAGKGQAATLEEQRLTARGLQTLQTLKTLKTLPRVAACPLPAHSPLLLGHSSLPFARLQTLQNPPTPSRRLPPSPLAVSLCCSRVAACPLPAHSPLLLGHSSLPFARLQTLQTLKPLKPSNSLAAASTKPSGRQPLLFQGCSLPFACT